MDITFRNVVADPVPEPPGPLDWGPWLQKLSTEQMVSLMEELVRGLSPPPCCIISDVYIPWARTVATNCGIHHHYLTTMSAASLALALSVSESSSRPVSGEMLGDNQSKKPSVPSLSVTCCDLSVFLYYFGLCFMDSSEIIGKFPEVLNFNRVFLRVCRFICK